mgnify:CR=1 FL=1
MTPGINAVKRAKVAHSIHEYQHDSTSVSYGIEAAEKLGVEPNRVFKTLVIKLDDKEFAVAVIPVALKVSMKKFAKTTGAKKAAMAESADVERVTGYVLGGVSPLGQKKSLKVWLDTSANNLNSLFVSAGRRGLEIELSPTSLAKLTNAAFVDICQ